MPSSFFPLARALVLSLGLAAISYNASARDDAPGSVYTLSNATDANRVLAFSRSASGTLTPAGAFPTGGKGTGAALGSQGALAMTHDGRFLVAVNAGSNDISVFALHHDALVLTDVAASGGLRPISITVADNLVYVLNAGGAAGATDNISGFYLSERGQLHALPGSTRGLSGENVGPAQISFGLRGDVLIVTEKATSRIDGFAIDDFGRAGPARVALSSGVTPFGFAISSRGYMFVSEAPGSALSSYRIHGDGSVNGVTGSIANHQGAACWVVLSKDEDFAYTANAASNSISSYRIGKNGAVTLVTASGLSAATDDGPIDLAVTGDGRFLYSLAGRSRTIVGFRLSEDGSLKRVADIGGVPAGAAGLVAR